MLGSVVGQGTRTVQPGKAQALKEWPAPSSIDDVVSFRAFTNYLREFIPRFQELDARLKLCTKKGAKWEEWLSDPENLRRLSMRRGNLWPTQPRCACRITRQLKTAKAVGHSSSMSTHASMAGGAPLPNALAETEPRSRSRASQSRSALPSRRGALLRESFRA